jgi:hypothetical protein
LSGIRTHDPIVREGEATIPHRISYLTKSYSSVGIVMGYGLDGRGSIPCRDKRFFSSTVHTVQTGSEANLASYVMGTGILSLGVEWQGREADH